MIATMPLIVDSEEVDNKISRIFRREDGILSELAKSLAHKIVVNFAINILDAGREIKMFTNKSEAVAWLNTFNISN